MFKKLSTNMEDNFFKMKLLRMKTITLTMKNTMDVINGKLAIAEEKISDFEDCNKSSKTKHRAKKFLKMKRALLKFWIISTGLKHIIEIP